MGALELLYIGIVRFLLPLISLLIFIFCARTVLHKLKRKTLAKFAIESYRDVVCWRQECLSYAIMYYSSIFNRCSKRRRHRIKNKTW